METVVQYTIQSCTDLLACVEASSGVKGVVHPCEACEGGRGWVWGEWRIGGQAETRIEGGVAAVK